MTFAIATSAMKKVQNFWRHEIPPPLKKITAKDIFVFHTTDKAYDIVFEKTFTRLFQPAKKISCRSAKVYREKTGASFFVSHETENLARRVHVAPKWKADASGTPDDREAFLAHEYIHWLSHSNFYPKYYSKGGACPDQVEGVTEMLMFMAFGHAGSGPLTLIYETPLRQIIAWRDSAKGNLDRILDFAFQGKYCDLTSAKPKTAP